MLLPSCCRPHVALATLPRLPTPNETLRQEDVLTPPSLDPAASPCSVAAAQGVQFLHPARPKASLLQQQVLETSAGSSPGLQETGAKSKAQCGAERLFSPLPTQGGVMYLSD